MEIREFSENILFGKSLLLDKLLQPETLTDEHPGSPILTPASPGRPVELDLRRWHDRAKIPFPSKEQLEKEFYRGAVLHFFANHELLAMELMALVLLKFPEAPGKFRRGIVQTILEEQKHLLLYYKRMQELGVGFGEIPVNDFFWNCLSSMASPFDFVSQMSLTFEQANLDFAWHYKNLMFAVGDNVTGDILTTVYEEEIGHVKHGLSWFRAWKNPAETDWQAYKNALPYPLSPSRAKGIGFQTEARKKAGFDDEFIQELAVFSASKGRPPSVYFFNPTCELEIARGRIGFQSVKNVEQRNEDLSSLLLFLAGHDDVALVPQIPTAPFLQKLKKAGFLSPEWLLCEKNKLPSSLAERRLGGFAPWGWSPNTRELFKPLVENLVVKNSFEQKTLTQPLFAQKMQYLYSKAFSLQLSREFYQQHPQLHGVIADPFATAQICFSKQEVLAALEKHLQFSPDNMAVIKSPFGTAGQNMCRVLSVHLKENENNWVEKILAQQHLVLVEPWLKKVADFSFQFKVEANKNVIPLGTTRFLTNNRGQYIGTLLGRKVEELPPACVRFLYALDKEKYSLFSLLEDYALWLGNKLASLGFVGPCGIDAFLYQERDGSFKVRCVSEINPRFTMGRIALELEKRLVPGTFALWMHTRVEDILARGFASPYEFSEALEKKFPLEIVGNENPMIKSGILFTNDPTTAQSVLTLLVVGKATYNAYAHF